MRNLLHEYCMKLKLDKDSVEALLNFAQANGLLMREIVVPWSYWSVHYPEIGPTYLHGPDNEIIGFTVGYWKPNGTKLVFVEVHDLTQDFEFSHIDKIRSHNIQRIDQVTTHAEDLYTDLKSGWVPSRSMPGEEFHRNALETPNIRPIILRYSSGRIQPTDIWESVVVYRGSHFVVSTIYKRLNFSYMSWSSEHGMDEYDIQISSEQCNAEKAKELGVLIVQYVLSELEGKKNKVLPSGVETNDHIDATVTVETVTEDKIKEAVQAPDLVEATPEEAFAPIVETPVKKPWWNRLWT